MNFKFFNCQSIFQTINDRSLVIKRSFKMVDLVFLFFSLLFTKKNIKIQKNPLIMFAGHYKAQLKRSCLLCTFVASSDR